VETAKRTGADVAGPIPSAHDHQPLDRAALASRGQKSREQFEIARTAPDRYFGTHTGHGGAEKLDLPPAGREIKAFGHAGSKRRG